MVEGVFGKLPAHGDFVQRGLPNTFVAVWDEWLQRAVYGSREIVGEQWLDYYLTSAIWRFALSPGVIDGKVWAGVLVPSVDSVGRYFPVTLCRQFDPECQVFRFPGSAKKWYSDLGDLGLSILQDALSADTLMGRFPVYEEQRGCTLVANRMGEALFLQGVSDDIEAAGLGEFAGQLISERHNSYSLWWNSCADPIASSMLLTPGLPQPEMYGAMIGAVSR